MKLCDYGCEREAKFQFGNGKWCCSDSVNKCIGKRKRDSLKKTGKKKGPCSEETKKKLREKREGKTYEEIYGDKAEEQKSKRKYSMKGKNIGPQTVEHIRKRSESHRGTKHGPMNVKTKNKIRETWTIERREKKKQELEKGEAKRINKYRKGLTELGRQSLKRRQTENWKNPEYQRKQQEAIHNKGPNGSESVILSILDKRYSNEWKFTGDKSFWIDGKNPDFINVNGQKKLMEFFGWRHTEKSTGVSNEVHEEKRIAHFRKWGWKTLVIWQMELKNIKEVENKIRNFINS